MVLEAGLADAPASGDGTGDDEAPDHNQGHQRTDQIVARDTPAEEEQEENQAQKGKQDSHAHRSRPNPKDKVRSPQKRMASRPGRC